MSHAFVTVQWNRWKIVYDLFLVAAVFVYVALFTYIGRRAFPDPGSISAQILAMRAWGTCAFLMLSLILAMGPLARLDRRFLPLVYNRRHFGVVFFFVALKHAMEVFDYYHAYGEVSKFESFLRFDASFTSTSLPFQWFGAGALAIFLVMAATSHDFWQKMLGASVWKGLHMLVYLGYALVVLHVAFGILQQTGEWAWSGLVFGSVVLVGGLHLAAAARGRVADRPVRTDENGWLDAGDVVTFLPDRARRIRTPDGRDIAVIRHDGGISAIHGTCAHQGGPLGEGRVIDGCLTCPWHGWQYLPADGRSPPPFTERLATHPVRVHAGRVWVNPEALPPGTAVTPADPRAGLAGNERGASDA